MSSTPLNEETLRKADVVLIATDHTNVDYQFVVDHSALVVDTRNATKRVKGASGKVVRA
jgi:UDP-N-acetyl-D-mannosaminuronate dehydrogenase